MARNILGEPLDVCCTDPMTGYRRDGFCAVHDQDRGSHVICAVVSDAFLEFTRAKGNDLQTPIPAYGFPGLKAGDGWCLCALRWKEAHEAGVAPMIKARATHERALQFVVKDVLLAYRID